MTFHTGHKTTPEHKARRFGEAHPSTAAEETAPEAALRQHMTAGKPDQGNTETCHAHTPASLIFVALAAAGTPLPWFPSPLGIGRNTYCEEQPFANGAELQDVGADLGDVGTSLGREGIRRMGPLAPGRFSDVTPENIRQRPTLADDEESARKLVLNLQQLQRTAPDFIPQIRTSIANMLCGVSVGIHANPAFQAYMKGAPAIVDASGFTDTDGHDVAALDYRTNPVTGELEVWLLSPWGPSFGDEGGAWVTASWLITSTLEAWRFRVSLKAATS